MVVVYNSQGEGAHFFMIMVYIYYAHFLQSSYLDIHIAISRFMNVHTFYKYYATSRNSMEL